MKSLNSIPLLILLFAFLSCASDSTLNLPTNEDESNHRQFYQLKTYTFDSPEQLAVTENYLKNAFIPATHKVGISNIGVFKTRPEASDTMDQLYVLIPFSSLGQFHSLESKLSMDNEYQSAGKDYIQAKYNQAPYARIESVLLEAFKDMPIMALPKLDGPRADRIYELRSYESATEAIFQNKVDMFNAGGEVLLFDKLGFNAVFYGEVISGAKMPNLMYMTTHANQTSREANWKAFVDSPEWIELKSMEKYQNNVSHIEIHFLYPTEYSDY